MRETPCSAAYPCHLTFSWYCTPCRERRNRSRSLGSCSYPTPSNWILPDHTRPPRAAGAPVNPRPALPPAARYGWTWNLIPPWAPAPWTPA